MDHSLSRRVSKHEAKPHHYLSRFLMLKCAPDLLELRLFPNAKEITESMACFHATERLPEGWEWNRHDITCVCVGDGCTPRTAALFAHRTAWDCISIDPCLGPIYYDVTRLTTWRRDIASCKPAFVRPNILWVLCHSHAPPSSVLTAIREARCMCSPPSRQAVITMDCCVKTAFPCPPDVVYEDKDVWSPCNTVKIWFDGNKFQV